ncbi:Arm DNA-binding domain-containing protein [Pseudomonas frederiksbergensis]|uniref:Arm DNA-binding domain-containing protein n=1 Tax=Pseudomonas frederiksbergensis TaxID=104087 RepID=UPI0031451EAE
MLGRSVFSWRVRWLSPRPRSDTPNPESKDYTLPDYNGLALFVNKKGAKCWHSRFSWADKQPSISLGTYPEISLGDGRRLKNEEGSMNNLSAKGLAPRERACSSDSITSLR